jgi:hypothetical protein
LIKHRVPKNADHTLKVYYTNRNSSDRTLA